MVDKGVEVGGGLPKERDDSYIYISLGQYLGIGLTWLIMTLGQGIQAVCLCFLFWKVAAAAENGKIGAHGAHSQDQIILVTDDLA